MKWFNDLKIGKKLTGAFIIITLITVLCVWFSIIELRNIAERDKFIYDNCLIAIQDLGRASSKIEYTIALTGNLVLSTNGNSRSVNIDTRNELTRDINANLKNYETKISTPEEKELYNKFIEARNDFGEKVEKLSYGNLKEAALFFQGDFAIASEKQRNALQNVIQYKSDYAKKISQSYEEKAEAAANSLIVLAIIGFLVSISLGLFIYNNIKKSISKLLNMARELQKGHVKARANINSEDEIGIIGKTLDRFANQLEAFAGAIHSIAGGDVSLEVPTYDKEDMLAPALNHISATLREVITEVNAVTLGASQGKLSIRANSDRFKGGYKDMIEGINNTLDAIISPLNVAAEYIDRISKGDMPAKITEQYTGDFNEIKNNVNGCIDAINSLIDNTKLLAIGAVEGKLSTRADASKHQGDFRKIVTGINDTLDALTLPLFSAVTVMNKIGKGEIPDPIQEEYKGDFNDLKQSINELIKTTKLLISGTKRIAQGVLDGKLNDRGRSDLFVGDWYLFVEDINMIINTLVCQIKFMGKNINDISKGNIPEQITGEYKGDYNEIKANLNVCFDSIGALIKDMNLLAEAATEGKLSVRADALKHKGDYAKIVGGVNNTLDALTTPLISAANVMDKIGKGEIPEPIMEEYKGDFNNLKHSINELIRTTKMILAGIKRIAQSVVSGRLDDRGRKELVVGDWHLLIEDINTIINTLTNQIKFMGANINNISKGNIPEQITAEYNGEFNETKKHLNVCFSSIKALIDDMNYLAISAAEGKLDNRADAVKHNGDFKKIIEGVNQTLNHFSAPIKEGVVLLNKMAEGDLTHRIHSDYKGDHQLIKNSINTVCDSLNQALGDVSEAIAATASASNQISSSTEEMAAGASEQTNQSIEVATGVEEMTKTILENTRNVSLAAETAKDAGQKALLGGKVVAETIEGMNKIAEVVKRSAETVHELGSNSDQIGEIVQVINDIADQTNLLALNAAIEAARAGEQGRGFAVVADEVRKLAERTTKATKEIAGMIKQIQKITVEAVDSMNEGTKEVEKGKILANNAGHSLREIVEGSQKVVDIVTLVATASEEQSATSEQISKNIEAISSVTAQSAAGTHQIANAAGDLNRLTLNLETLINKFKLDTSNYNTRQITS